MTRMYPSTKAPRAIFAALTGMLALWPVHDAARLVADPPPAEESGPTVARDPEALFQEIKARYDPLKGGAAPEERVPILLEFEKAPCDATVKYLASLYRVEKNIGVHMAITTVLGSIGTKDAVEAVVRTGAGLLAGDAFASTAIAQAFEKGFQPDGEKWFLQRGTMVKALRSNGEVWTRILRAVGKFRSPERVKFLTGEIYKRGNSPEAQIALLEAVEDIRDATVATAASRLLRAREPEVQVAALQCLYNQDARKYRSRFTAGLKSEHWQVRLLSLAILSNLKEKKIVEHAVRFLNDPDVHVQIVAVRSLMDHGGKEVIEPLIQRLNTAKGRIADDIADALARLTGKNFGPVGVQWESWWAQPANRQGEFEKMSAAEFSRLKEGDKDQQTLLYHGLRVISDNVAFIIDSSESMTLKYVPKDDREERGTTVVESSDPTGKEQTRMAVAKVELHQVLQGLRDGKRFNVIGFDSVITDFIQDAMGKPPEHLETMSGETRAKARQFVEAARASGQTHMLKALRTAFAYEELDTIFLLSDGAPTPESGTMKEIDRYLRKINRLRSVKINTIGFDLERKERAFLRHIAEEHFGVFIER